MDMQPAKPLRYVLPFYALATHDPKLAIPTFGEGWASVYLEPIEEGRIVRIVGYGLLVRKFEIADRMIVGTDEVPIEHVEAACPLPIGLGFRCSLELARNAPDRAICRVSAVIDVSPPRCECRNPIRTCPGGFLYHEDEAAPVPRLPSNLRLR
jgi:hypothetical protein